MSSLPFYTYLLPLVSDLPLLFTLDKDEGALLLHTCEGALTLAYGEGLLLFIPADRDAAAGSRLVVMVGAFVFVEAEGGIGTGIDA